MSIQHSFSKYKVHYHLGLGFFTGDEKSSSLAVKGEHRQGKDLRIIRIRPPARETTLEIIHQRNRPQLGMFTCASFLQIQADFSLFG